MYIKGMPFFILALLMTKSELRIKYKKLRSFLSKEEINTKSIAIANQLLQMDIWHYENYHIFLPIYSQNEINTEFILHILQGKDKNIIISKSNFENLTLQHFLLTDNTILKNNSWGIPEPEGGITVNSKSIDLVFCPLLAYDLKGNRVGYGKGFYDRFLTESKPKKVIGLSFFPPEKTISNIVNEDYRLDSCILPDKIYEFN